jgi:hypothetical protein
MMRSFACADTEALFHSRPVSRFRNIERVARRKVLRIHAATELASLRVPPGNPLKARNADRPVAVLRAEGAGGGFVAVAAEILVGARLATGDSPRL